MAYRCRFKTYLQAYSEEVCYSADCRTSEFESQRSHASSRPSPAKMDLSLESSATSLTNNKHSKYKKTGGWVVVYCDVNALICAIERLLE